MQVTQDTGFGQKLDRVLVLLETQRKEIDSIKVDTAGLKSEFEALKQRIWDSPVSSSVDSTPPSRKKLPTELSGLFTDFMKADDEFLMIVNPQG